MFLSFLFLDMYVLWMATCMYTMSISMYAVPAEGLTIGSLANIEVQPGNSPLELENVDVSNSVPNLGLARKAIVNTYKQNMSLQLRQIRVG